MGTGTAAFILFNGIAAANAFEVDYINFSSSFDDKDIFYALCRSKDPVWWPRTALKLPVVRFQTVPVPGPFANRAISGWLGFFSLSLALLDAHVERRYNVN